MGQIGVSGLRVHKKRKENMHIQEVTVDRNATAPTTTVEHNPKESEAGPCIPPPANHQLLLHDPNLNGITGVKSQDHCLDATPVYRALAQHQQNENWECRDLMRELQRWAEIFNIQFKLKIPAVSLCVDYLGTRRLGHYRYGHNGFGLRREIAINRRYLDSSKFWQVLGILLHELLHAWQDSYGKPGRGNYHNVEFRNKAKQYGLIVDHRGVTHFEPDSPFMDLLREHSVRLPVLPQPQITRSGSSKLKKWSCGCTNVRVAVADFQARCLKCGNLFVRSN